MIHAAGVYEKKRDREERRIHTDALFLLTPRALNIALFHLTHGFKGVIRRARGLSPPDALFERGFVSVDVFDLTLSRVPDIKISKPYGNAV